MPSNDDVLRKQAYKGEVEATELRALYTLFADNLQRPLRTPSLAHDRLVARRTANLLGVLIRHLEGKGILDEAEIDAILLQTIS
jgi:hypothetical protein